MKKICLSLVTALFSVMSVNALDITGTINNWSQSDHMKETAPGVYTWTGDFKADEEFKFLSDHDWAPGWAADPNQEGVRTFQKTADVTIVYVDEGESYNLVYRPENNNSTYPDNKFWMAKAGRYTITVDLSKEGQETMTCTPGGNPEPEPDLEGPDHADAWPMPEGLMMVGSAANGKSGTWGLGEEWLRQLSPTENENEYTWTGLLYSTTDTGNNSEFKFVWGYNWEPAYVTVKANLKIEDGKTYPLVYKPDGSVADNKFNVPVSGIYTLTVKADEFYPTLKVTLVEESAIEPNQKLYITGGATPCGWSTGGALEMMTTDNIHFTWTGELLTKDDSCFRFLTSKNWYPTYTTAKASTAESVVTPGTYPIQYDKNFRPGEPAFKIAESGNYTVNINIDPEVVTMELIRNVPKYESVILQGTAVEGSSIPMRGVTPSRFVAFLQLTDGAYTFKAVDIDGNEVILGGGEDGSLTAGADGIVSSAPGLVRITLSTTEDSDSFEILPITSLNLTGNIVPDGTTIAYAGNGVWSETVKLDKTPPSVLDYPSHQFYFLFNNDENLAVKRHSGSYSVDMPYDSYTGLENIRMNNGTYTVSLNMRDFTFGVDADIDPVRISTFGSSVANGQGADYQEGYSYYYGEQLKERHAAGLSPNAFYTSGVAIGGNTTKDLLNRYDDIIRDFGKYVIIGLSMGNEGIHDTSDKQSIFNQFRDNMLTLITKLRADGKVPIVVNNYTRSDYNDSDYDYIKQMNMLIHAWDVPSFNSLGSIDDGAGHWADGYIADAFHPNTAGHKEFMYGMVPSLFDALAAGKSLPSRDTTNELDLDENTTVTLTPEGTTHSFTVNARVKGNHTGNILTFEGGNVAVTDGGAIAYTSTGGNAKTSASVLADGEWHDVALTHYYARGYTALYIDGKVAGEVSERFELKGDIEFGGAPLKYSEISFWRAGMNETEMTAHHNGEMLKSSLEIYSPMTLADETIANLAQSTNALVFKNIDTGIQYTMYGAEELRIAAGNGNAVFFGCETPVNVYSVDGKLLKTVVPSAAGNQIEFAPGLYIAGKTRFLVK